MCNLFTGRCEAAKAGKAVTISWQRKDKGELALWNSKGDTSYIHPPSNTHQVMSLAVAWNTYPCKAYSTSNCPRSDGANVNRCKIEGDQCKDALSSGTSGSTSDTCYSDEDCETGFRCQESQCARLSACKLGNQCTSSKTLGTAKSVGQC